MATTDSKRNRGKWLILPIEVKAREFDAKLLLAGCAVARGYSVLVGPARFFKHNYHWLPSAIVLESSASINKSGRFEALRQQHKKIVVNDEESLAVYRQTRQFLETRVTADTLSHTDRYLAWGQRQADLVGEQYPDLCDRLAVTGTPRSDVWRPELRSLYAARAEELRSRFGRYILLPSNFATLIHANGEDFVLRQAYEYGLIRTDADREWFEGHLEHVRGVFPRYVDALERIHSNFPDHSLIIRPHPSDSHAAWHEAIRHLDRCHVVYEGEPAPWLLGADAIFHHGCSTGMEAWLLGKAPIAYLPHRDERFEGPLQVQTSAIVEEQDGLLNAIAESIEGALAVDLDTEWFDRHYLSSTARLASDRIVDVCDELDLESDDLDLSLRNPGYREFYWQKAIRGVKRRLPSRPVVSRGEGVNKGARATQKFPGIGVGEMSTRFAEIQRLSGRFEGVAPQQIFGSVFRLSPGAGRNGA